MLFPSYNGFKQLFLRLHYWQQASSFNRHGHLLSNLHLLHLQGNGKSTGNWLAPFMTGTIKLWININGILVSYMIANVSLKIRTINKQFYGIWYWRKLLQVEGGRLLVEHLVAEKMLIHDLVKTINKLPF